MTEDEGPSNDSTAAGGLLDLVRRRFWMFVSVGLVGVAVAAFVGVDLSLGRSARLVLLTAVLTAPFGYIVAKRVLAILWQPEWIYLIDVDARDLSDAGIYRFPYESFLELETVDGELAEAGPRLYFGKQVDLDEMTAEGTWPGTLDDRELLVALQKVRECRDQLEADAKRGFIFQTSAWAIVRKATIRATSTIVRTFERGTLPDDGDGLTDSVDDALEEFDLDRFAEQVGDDPDPTLDDLVDGGDDQERVDHAEDLQEESGPENTENLEAIFND